MRKQLMFKHNRTETNFWEELFILDNYVREFFYKN